MINTVDHLLSAETLKNYFSASFVSSGTPLKHTQIPIIADHSAAWIVIHPWSLQVNLYVEQIDQTKVENYLKERKIKNLSCYKVIEQDCWPQIDNIIFGLIENRFKSLKFNPLKYGLCRTVTTQMVLGHVGVTLKKCSKQDCQ